MTGDMLGFFLGCILSAGVGIMFYFGRFLE